MNNAPLTASTDQIRHAGFVQIDIRRAKRACKGQSSVDNISEVGIDYSICIFVPGKRGSEDGDSAGGCDGLGHGFQVCGEDVHGREGAAVVESPARKKAGGLVARSTRLRGDALTRAAKRRLEKCMVENI